MSPTMKKSTKIILGSVAGVVFIGGCSAAMSGGTDSEAKPNDRTAVQPSETPAEKKTDKPAAPKKTQAEELQACIKKTGTPTEKDAAGHITKVSGAENGDWIGMAEIFTDYSGSLMSGDANKGKLLASAFGSCYKSDDGNSGLVTVYNKDGEVLSNGNY